MAIYFWKIICYIIYKKIFLLSLKIFDKTKGGIDYGNTKS